MPQQAGSALNDSTVKRRRKKASRACSHCQKAHLTCDDSRPCQRCIKRGLEDTCADGVRKKAKYLQEDDNERLQQQQISVMAPTPPLPQQQQQQQPIMNFIEGNHTTGFGSNTTSLEYGMLSSMIPILDTSNNTNNPYQPVNIPNTTNSNSTTTITTPNWLIQPAPIDTNTIVLNNVNSTNTSPSISSLTPQPSSAMDYNNSTPTVGDRQRIIRRRKGIGNTPYEIYTRVQRPYNYAESYHHLIEYVRCRMGRNELLRISRALVLFRPSYMSLVAALTEEDLIYMEKCVQRTLLEFEKLISFSGTPTVVWRRTGEIVLVGKEFLLLTQWSKETLLGKKTYIYELMDNGSAIEYWEKFSQHAFDNTESALYMSVILMSPSFRPVPCSFCFTLKRDIFDLPCVVVGNFLPILGANTGRS
ncbi:uncharacterized protein BX663DRAFT_508305 [Cokeromyces recurvatus]|uniref:uncharacterized protein n=1 Tax=Cokeromyces recurvatus TaxID=90255 RepID=UPI00222002A6|nr:uncharacterized protein BX663DRAFT_508305 [Cokeromyces recurvatus]KAI7903347.1 hypothetical protein BX663DRAFT_508305 [Cokeromyces recurvatus]